MECKVTVLCLCLLIANVQTTEVQLDSVWKPEVGWEVTCSWKLFSNDTLQSVRLYSNDQQFMVFRPEEDGDNRGGLYRRPDFMMTVNCSKTDRGVVGACVLTTQLYQPLKDELKYECEVSGERPKFIVARRFIVIEAFVPPTDAVVKVESKNAESGLVMLNCTSSGVPAPNLAWTVGEQMVPHDFTGTVWNATSKLWDAWSVLSFTPASEHTAICTPEINRGNQVIEGHAAEYNSAEIVKDVRTLIGLIVISQLLLR